jgi:hypothetical protein
MYTHKRDMFGTGDGHPPYSGRFMIYDSLNRMWACYCIDHLIKPPTAYKDCPFCFGYGWPPIPLSEVRFK